MEAAIIDKCINNQMKNVALILLRKNKRFLLIQRFIENIYGGLWSFPGGLKDDCDNDIFATAKRELFEEIGLAAKHIRMTHQINIENYIFDIFICDDWEGKLKIEESEIEGIGWFTIQEIYNMKDQLAPWLRDNLDILWFFTRHD